MTSSLAQFGVSEAISSEEPLSRWVARELERLKDAALVVLGVPAPRVSLDRFLALVKDEEALLWDPPGEPGFAGAGCAREVRAQGPSRFVEAQQLARSLFASVKSAHRERPNEGLALLFGGFSCFPNQALDALWQSFGEARFVLPRILYKLHSDGTATFGVTCDLDSKHSPAELVRSTVGTITEWLERLNDGTSAPLPQERTPSILEQNELGEAEWGSLVGQISRNIEAKTVEKVVAARRSSLQISPTPEWRDVLLRLAGDNNSCTRFALHHADCTFLGATPERLIRKFGTHFDTEALAGSARSGAESAQMLLGSQKDLEEHAIVVREIKRSLGPFAAELTAPGTPSVHALHYVSHLRTPIEGTLRASTHILDLVAALHPTPAVGGVPKADAERLILANERDRRGWYAGPIGWFDRHGDGSFAVALRSALLESNYAHLYAGAGIVRGSDPHAEYQETQLKLQGLLRALGVSA
ncbi:MAG: isochorismate synthase [Polyangiaceae bacterium]|nr:isochorismate synthase [Polyangiaceae bacterium]